MGSERTFTPRNEEDHEEQEKRGWWRVRVACPRFVVAVLRSWRTRHALREREREREREKRQAQSVTHAYSSSAHFVREAGLGDGRSYTCMCEDIKREPIMLRVMCVL